MLIWQAAKITEEIKIRQKIQINRHGEKITATGKERGSIVGAQTEGENEKEYGFSL